MKCKNRQLFFSCTARQIIAAILLLIASNTAFAILLPPLQNTVSGSGLVNSGHPNPVRILWTGASDTVGSNSPGQAFEVFSESGRFEIGQTAIETNNSRISVNLLQGSVNPFSISENLVISQRVVAAALQQNSQTIRYVRTFIDSTSIGRELTSVATFRLTSSSAGALSISQIDLRFESGSTTLVVQREQDLRAVAFVTHGGSGLFDAVWEVTSPASSVGTPIFFTLKTERQFLAGSRQVVLTSPALPTEVAGNYRLRLRVSSPSINFDQPLLRYTVLNQIEPSEQVDLISLKTPEPNTVADDRTVFSWDEISRAASYQLEIYALQGQRLLIPSTESSSLDLDLESQEKVLITGILLPNSQQIASLTSLMTSRLEAGKTYVWRVIAMNNRGDLVGESQDRIVYIKP